MEQGRSAPRRHRPALNESGSHRMGWRETRKSIVLSFLISHEKVAPKCRSILDGDKWFVPVGEMTKEWGGITHHQNHWNFLAHSPRRNWILTVLVLWLGLRCLRVEE
mmetsp:Transcript_4076/g.7847  ORF Transcript_4076/g.7847 Transcript_4076/m.7847 type:complete len:107 (-) Transcript_4076:3641-3961(-)